MSGFTCPEDETPIEVLGFDGLSERTRLAFRRGGFPSVESVESVDNDRLMEVRDVGSTRVKEIRRAIAHYRRQHRG